MRFEMIGKLSISKETEKFKPYVETTYTSGWVKKKLVFNAICGDNRHSLTIDSGAYSDGHNDVHTFSKQTVDAEGNRKKGEPLAIPFKDRLKQSNVDKVAEFRKFIIDLEKPGKRAELKKALDKIKEGTTLTDEELNKLGVNEESELEAAYEKSCAKKHEYISEWDYVDFVKKVIESGKYTDKKFKIRGNGSYSYSDNNQRVYENYVPTRIELMDDSATEMSEANLTLLFNKDSLDDMSLEEKGKYYVNGYIMEYDSGRKSNIPVATTIAIVANGDDEKIAKKAEIIKKKFIVEDDSWKELGLVVKMLNGAQRTEITEDMLTDEQKEDLEWGLITMDDIRAELGSDVYGERIRELQFEKIGYGYTKGRQDTVYTDEDMVIKPLVTEEENYDDLFDDDDDI